RRTGVGCDSRARGCGRSGARAEPEYERCPLGVHGRPGGVPGGPRPEGRGDRVPPPRRRRPAVPTRRRPLARTPPPIDIRPGWLPAWGNVEDHPKELTCPCYPDRAPAREGRHAVSRLPARESSAGDVLREMRRPTEPYHAVAPWS